MSPRQRRLRRIMNPPEIKGLKPYGRRAAEKAGEIIVMPFEEYESLRLCDYDGYTHIEASEIMGVSRPTFTRIYAAARRKVALAFVEGRQLSIEGGKIYYDSDWFECSGCGCFFNNPDKQLVIANCPLCGSGKIAALDTEQQEVSGECGDVCICSRCGYEQLHMRGIPCSELICPECNSYLRRKSAARCRSRGK